MGTILESWYPTIKNWRLLKRLHNLSNRATANDHALTAHIKFTKINLNGERGLLKMELKSKLVITVLTGALAISGIASTRANTTLIT